MASVSSRPALRLLEVVIKDSTLNFTHEKLRGIQIPVLQEARINSSLPDYSFQVLHGGKEEWVRLDSKALMHGFQISDKLLGRAAQECSLLKLALLKFLDVRSGMPLLNVHLGAKDYRLTHPVYIGMKGGLFYGIKDSLFQRGGSADLKIALNAEKQPITRRIHYLKQNEMESARKFVANMQALCGRPGIIPLYDVCCYVSTKGEIKLVSFHPLYEMDLLARFRRPISEEDIIGYASQLFIGLLSIEGAHCDLKPENILLRGKELVLCDLEHVQYKDGTYQEAFGTANWMPPEMFREKRVIVSKYDVWAAGIILLCLFTSPKIVFPDWMMKLCSEDDVKMLVTQEKIDRLIHSAKLTEHQRILIKNMFRVDVELRWTIQEAAAYFRRYIARE